MSSGESFVDSGLIIRFDGSVSDGSFGFGLRMIARSEDTFVMKVDDSGRRAHKFRTEQQVEEQITLEVVKQKT